MPADSQNSPWMRVFLYLVILDLLVITLAIVARMSLNIAPLTAFHVFFYGAQVALALAVIGLGQLVFGGLKKHGAHIKTGALTLLLALVPLACSVMVVGTAGFSAPMIHDISTDMHDPPVFSITNSLRTAEENSLDYAGETVARLQREAFPGIQPYFSTFPPAEARNQALRTVAALGWTLVVDDESTGIIEAYDQSRIFGFIDDVAIRITPIEDGSQVDVRSVSRVGIGDLGANAHRIRRFFREFASAEAGQ